MNQPIHNAYWLSRFDSLLDSALAQHRAVSLIRVDLRFPEYMPATIMDTDLDSAVISRFFASLKAKIQAYQQHKRRASQRVHATSLRYFWCREFGEEENRKHYHVILLLNKDTWCSLGDFSEPSSLAAMIQEAWCSALHLEPWQGDGLVHFSRWKPFRKPASSDAPPSSADTPLPGGCTDTRKAADKKPGEAAVLWIKRGDVAAMQKARNRALYLVKYETKQHDGSGQRNYGCSRGLGRLLDGR
ncbi:inovirus Gp2 family protein [Escherichia coli]|nr:inovirus Gp2 family protein [Escherichia coli]EJD9412158.1 inovirus Gp2 family protein [Escherichia coli]EJI7120687.1 inovirus Gp2 family protein [Escherichia coli]ELJ6765489.1 inovirus Gp2 family protein [Escherichia coli]ELK5020754.1 inovirus Gp2 family protein [Escherichia coli]